MTGFQELRSTVNDQECLNKIKAGGQQRVDGISQLYRSYARRFLAYFLKHRVPREHAEDLVQDVFVNVVRHCGDFRGETRIDAWMWAIVRNCLIDYFRRSRPEDAVDEDDLVKLADVGQASQPDRGTGLEDCVQRAFAAFAEVYRDRAEVLRLVAFEGWSIAEVAAVLKRTPGATREYISQCRKKLQSFLEPCREFLVQ